MRWVKHICRTSADLFIRRLEEKFGLEGYARFWKLVEAIGEQVTTVSKDPTLAMTWPVWCSILKVKKKKLLPFLEFLALEGKINWKETVEVLTISYPNVLKYRDESARKSGIAPDEVAHENEEVRTEDPLEGESESEFKKRSLQKAPLKGNGRFPDSEIDYDADPSQGLQKCLHILPSSIRNQDQAAMSWFEGSWKERGCPFTPETLAAFLESGNEFCRKTWGKYPEIMHRRMKEAQEDARQRWAS